MNKSVCEREDRTSEAARLGMIDCETSRHAQQCAICSDILLVNELANDDPFFSELDATTLPDAASVWHNAQLRARNQALRVALRPIRYMKVLACIAFACSPWLRSLLPVVRELDSSWSRALDFNVAFASKFWPLIANESTILLASTGTLVLLGLSSWYMLRQE